MTRALLVLAFVMLAGKPALAQRAGSACPNLGQVISVPNDARGALICNGSTYEVYESVITGPLRAGIGTASPASALDVNGGVRIGADSASCTAAKEGTIRYVAAS